MPFTPNGQAANLVFLLEIEICLRIDTAVWTQAAGPNLNCWFITPADGEPSKVEASGLILVDEGSIAGCNNPANEPCYFWDATTGRLYVNVDGGTVPTPASPCLGAFYWRRYNTQDGETYGGKPYRPVLDAGSIPDIGAEIGGFHEGGTRFSFGAIRLLNGDGHFDALLDTYIWEAKRVIVRLGEKGKGDANYVVILDGWTGDIEWDDEAVTIATEDARTVVS